MNAVYILASDKAIGGAHGPKTWNTSTKAADAISSFSICNGQPGRLTGFLTTDGINVSGGPSIAAWAGITCGATSLIGLSGPGYAEFGSMSCQDGGGGGEQPFWFYAEPGGTVRFGSISYHNTSKRYNPIQIWGGGTVIAPSGFWRGYAQAYLVRDGRLVIPNINAVSAQFADTHLGDIIVGVRHPKTFKVRAAELGYPSNVETSYSAFQADPRTLAFSTAPVIDGVTVEAGDLVMINCSDGNNTRFGSCYNGLWVVGEDVTTWTRHTDFDDADEIISDIGVEVLEGTTCAGTRWFLNHDSYRIRERKGSAHTMTFCDHGYTPIFIEEVRQNPEAAFLVETAIPNLTNRIDVVDNQSTGESTLGAYAENIAQSFGGVVTITKPGVTLIAPKGSTVTFSGSLNGTFGVKKTGAGAVALTPAEANFSVTNLVMTDGRLTVASARLASGLKKVELPFTAGGSAELALDGDVDLDGWTFDVQDLYRPEAKTAPAPFTFTVTSSDGTVSGEPTVTLGGAFTRNWVATHEGNVWTVSYIRKGFALILK